MSRDACPIPTPTADDDEERVIQRLVRATRIAVVGLSGDPMKPSANVAAYLASAGKEVLPVNPNHTEIMGLKCYPSLRDVPGPIDLVDVFRRPEYVADVTRDAIAAGARAVWLQSGITSDAAARLARVAGIDFVQNRCLMVEHMRHST